MRTWKIVIGVFFAGGHSISAAHAQPEQAKKTIVLPPKSHRVRPTETAAEIKQDLTEFVSSINNGSPFSEDQKWIFMARDGYFGANEWMRKWRLQNVIINIQEIAIDEVEDNEQGASATITYSITSLNATRNDESKVFLGRERRETVNFRPENIGKDRIWKIVPPGKQPQDLKISDFNNVFALMSFSLAQKDIYVISPEAGLSMARLKQLFIGATAFAQQYEGRYAFAPEYLQEALLPYVPDKAAFFVPGTKEAYGFNGNLSDLHLDQVDEAVETVLFYEGSDEMPSFRYGGKAAICFADGHIMLIWPEQTKTLIWKP